MTDSAAVMTFFAVLSIFPGLLVVVSLLGVVGQAGATTRAVLRLLGQFGAPAGAVAVLEDPVRDLTGLSAAGPALVTGSVGALWTASGYVRALGRCMNRIYEVEEGRPFWKLCPMMFGITLALVVLVGAMMLLLLLSGPVAERLGGLTGLGAAALHLWNAARVPVLLAGAEFNAEIERGRELQAGIVAEEALQLPPRDSRGIQKLQVKEQELISEGRELRRNHAHAGCSHDNTSDAAPASPSVTGALPTSADARSRDA